VRKSRSAVIRKWRYQGLSEFHRSDLVSKTMIREDWGRSGAGLVESLLCLSQCLNHGVLCHLDIAKRDFECQCAAVPPERAPARRTRFKSFSSFSNRFSRLSTYLDSIRVNRWSIIKGSDPHPFGGPRFCESAVSHVPDCVAEGSRTLAVST
jgi:hypothetical protein